MPWSSKVDVEAVEHLLEDVRDGQVLEDAALRLLGQQPELRHDLGAVLEKLVIGILAQLNHVPLGQPVDDAVEESFGLVRQVEFDRDGVAEEAVERHGPLLVRRKSSS